MQFHQLVDLALLEAPLRTCRLLDIKRVKSFRIGDNKNVFILHEEQVGGDTDPSLRNLHVSLSLLLLVVVDNHAAILPSRY